MKIVERGVKAILQTRIFRLEEKVTIVSDMDFSLYCEGGRASNSCWRVLVTGAIPTR